METLLDIKKALMEIPNELLGNVVFALGEGCEEEISMVAQESNGEYDFPQIWDTVEKKYPKLNELNKLIQNIAKAQVILDEQETAGEELSERLMEGDGITQDYFDKKKK